MKSLHSDSLGNTSTNKTENQLGKKEDKEQNHLKIFWTDCMYVQGLSESHFQLKKKLIK